MMMMGLVQNKLREYIKRKQKKTLLMSNYLVVVVVVVVGWDKIKKFG